MDIHVIDAHTHIQLTDFDADREAVIARAAEKGVGMIVVGVDGKTSQGAVSIAQQHEHMWAAVGYHPHDADDFFDTRDAIDALAHRKEVVGIGECGLDYFKLDTHLHPDEAHQQKELFRWHIDLSHRARKPLVIHCREAFADTLSILEAEKENLLKEPGICHFFTGTMDDARRLLALNFSFTFGGLMTFNRSFDEVIRFIPSNHILVETDAPFVSPVPHRGTRNEPVYVLETVSFLARIKEKQEVEMKETLLSNTQRVFGI